MLDNCHIHVCKTLEAICTSSEVQIWEFQIYVINTREREERYLVTVILVDGVFESISTVSSTVLFGNNSPTTFASSSLTISTFVGAALKTTQRNIEMIISKKHVHIYIHIQLPPKKSWFCITKMSEVRDDFKDDFSKSSIIFNIYVALLRQLDKYNVGYCDYF